MKDFNAHVPSDIVAVLDASAVLEITEFRLFELAWRERFGSRPDQQHIERYFAAYMFADRVPHWVRSFARHILQLNAEGRLDPKAFGVWQRLPSSRMRFSSSSTVLHCSYSWWCYPPPPWTSMTR